MKNHLFFTVALLVFVDLSVCAQILVGSPMEGSAPNAYFGRAVSMSADGQVLAVGSPFQDADVGETVGQVQVFSWNGNDWEAMGAVLEGSSEGEVFGYAVALSADGQVLAVGSIGYDSGAGLEDVGRVQVYAWDGSSWSMLGAPIEGDMIGAVFGTAVALSSTGDVLVVGAPLYSANFQLNSGQVRMYTWNGSSWELDEIFNGEEAGGRFGFALDLSDAGDVLAIAAPFSDAFGGLAGEVKVYSENGGNWELQSNGIYGVAGSFLGSSLSLSGDGQVLAVGAPFHNGNGFEAGQVKVYSHWSGSWEQVGGDLTGVSGDHFGSALSLSADGLALAVGSPTYSGNSGRVQYFLWDGSDWSQNGVDIVGPSNGAKCGEAVSMKAQGDWVVVGSPQDNTAAGSNAGSVRVFEICPPTSSEISVVACQSYLSPSGNEVYTLSGTYQDEILNAAGCGDSIITIDLTVVHIDTSVAYDGALLVSNATLATYQWVSCDDDYAWIPGETQSFFEPQEEGNYAVIVTQNGCSDTSACWPVIHVGIKELGSNSHAVMLYPNPGSGDFSLLLSSEFWAVQHCFLYSLSGQELSRWDLPKGRNRYDLSLPPSVPSGMYIWELRDAYGRSVAIGKLLLYRE